MHSGKNPSTTPSATISMHQAGDFGRIEQV